MRIDAHHHLWDLKAVHYPWLMEAGAVRFFGDPTPIQRDFLLDEFRGLAAAEGFAGSVTFRLGQRTAMPRPPGFRPWLRPTPTGPWRRWCFVT